METVLSEIVVCSKRFLAVVILFETIYDINIPIPNWRWLRLIVTILERANDVNSVVSS